VTERPSAIPPGRVPEQLVTLDGVRAPPATPAFTRCSFELIEPERIDRSRRTFIVPATDDTEDC
jgi:hypothetical protein